MFCPQVLLLLCILKASEEQLVSSGDKSASKNRQNYLLLAKDEFFVVLLLNQVQLPAATKITEGTVWTEASPPRPQRRIKDRSRTDSESIQGLGF